MQGTPLQRIGRVSSVFSVHQGSGGGPFRLRGQGRCCEAHSLWEQDGEDDIFLASCEFEPSPSLQSEEKRKKGKKWKTLIMVGGTKTSTRTPSKGQSCHCTLN